MRTRRSRGKGSKGIFANPAAPSIPHKAAGQGGRKMKKISSHGLKRKLSDIGVARAALNVAVSKNTDISSVDQQRMLKRAEAQEELDKMAGIMGWEKVEGEQ